MKVLKRNQIIVSVIALMLITVGYMSFSSNINNTAETGADAQMAGIGDAQLVSNDVSAEGLVDNQNTEEDVSNNIDMVETSVTNQADYFMGSRLERDKMYSQMLETYQGLVENNNIASDQKNISTQEIAKINNKKNSIMIAENLIKNLGFEDVVVFVNDNSTSVIVKAEKLSEADVAQIQNIVCREIGVNPQDIHISVK